MNIFRTIALCVIALAAAVGVYVYAQPVDRCVLARQALLKFAQYVDLHRATEESAIDALELERLRGHYTEECRR